LCSSLLFSWSFFCYWNTVQLYTISSRAKNCSNIWFWLNLLALPSHHPRFSTNFMSQTLSSYWENPFH
jgi:hypothetical protein